MRLTFSRLNNFHSNFDCRNSLPIFFGIRKKLHLIARTSNVLNASNGLILNSKYSSSSAGHNDVTERSVDLPQFSQKTLHPSNIRVAAIDTPGAAVAAAINVSLPSNLARSPLSQASSAALFAIEKMAFQQTTKYSKAEMRDRMDQLVGAVQARSTRDSLLFSGATLPANLPLLLDILQDSLFNPIISAEDLQEVQLIAQYEADEIRKRPEILLPELAHQPAFYPPNFTNMKDPCSPLQRAEIFKDLKVDQLMDTWRHLMETCKIDVLCSGAPLSSFFPQTSKVFYQKTQTKSPFSSSFSSSSSNNTRQSKFPVDCTDSEEMPSDSKNFQSQLDRPNSATTFHSSTNNALNKEMTSNGKYCGGGLYLEEGNEELLHLLLAYEGASPSATPKESCALACLQMLLGGGSAFSAGGPGKGMYSRLYLQVLNRHHWVESCRVATSADSFGGIFGIQASARPAHGRDLARLLVAHSEGLLSQRMDIVELNRAKNQLKSALLMGLESRVAQVEHLAECVTSEQPYMSPKQICDTIDTLTQTDLQQQAHRLLSTKPTIVAYGPISALPSYETICSWTTYGRK